MQTRMCHASTRVSCVYACRASTRTMRLRRWHATRGGGATRVAAVRRGVAGTGAVATLKLRSGYDDKGLLRENLLAAQAGGAEFITLHPRTRAQKRRKSQIHL